MSATDLSGWVVVVAGDDPALCEVARAALAAGAAVGVVSAHLVDETPASVRFRADPHDADAWQRIGMHIEQHLGPIDGVVSDASAHRTVQQVFDADLRRRGRASAVVVGPADSADAIVTALLHSTG